MHLNPYLCLAFCLLCSAQSAAAQDIIVENAKDVIVEEVATKEKASPDAPTEEEAPATKERGSTDAPTGAEGAKEGEARDQPNGASKKLTVLLMLNDEHQRLVSPVRQEFAAAGYSIVVVPAPAGDTALIRASNAQQSVRQTGVNSAIYVETTEPAGASVVHAIGPNESHSRHAPLPAKISTVKPRVFAVVSGSLLEELETPPKIRVTLTVEADREVDLIVNGEEKQNEKDALVGADPVPPTEEPTTKVPSEDLVVEGNPPVRIPQPEPVEDYAFFGADLVPGVGSSTIHGSHQRRVISLGLLGTLSGDVRTLNLSGGLNIVHGNMTGFQMGLASSVDHDIDGAQLGLFNLSRGRDSRGAQLGLVNATGHLKGVQFGLVNYARTSSFQLGLINIQREGRTKLELSVNEGAQALALLKHGGKHYHYIYGVGVRPFGRDDISTFSLALGLGLHLPITKKFFGDLDGIIQYFPDFDQRIDGTYLAQLRLVFGYQLFKKFALLFGASFNVQASSHDDPISYEGLTFSKETVPFCTDPRVCGELTVRAYGGLLLGVQFL